MKLSTTHLPQTRAHCQPPLTDALKEIEEIDCARHRAGMARKRYERTGDVSSLMAATTDEKLADALTQKYQDIWLNRGTK